MDARSPNHWTPPGRSLPCLASSTVLSDSDRLSLRHLLTTHFEFLIPLLASSPFSFLTSLWAAAAQETVVQGVGYEPENNRIRNKATSALVVLFISLRGDFVCVRAQLCLTLYSPMDCVACQAPLSMGFSRQEYWSGLPFLTPGDLPNPGIKPRSPGLAGRFFTTSTTVFCP